MSRERSWVNVPARPKEPQAGKQADKSLKVSRLFHKSAHPQLVRLVNLLARHRPGIHHYRNMLVDRMLLQPAQHCQPVHNRHPVIQNDDTRLAFGPIAKSSFPFQTVEHFLSIASDHRIAFDLRGIKRPFYKEDVIGVIFPEEYPAAMWHIVNV